jgi:hypothetical protein
MPARVIAVDGQTVTLELTIDLSRSLLETEERILAVLNEAGCLATQEALKQLDTDGSPLKVGPVKLTSKGPVPKAYQTPYGEVTVARHVYQTAQGGKTFCPLDQAGRIVVTSTPRFAKLVAHKCAQAGSPQVERDLAENHGRVVARSYLQHVAEAVGSVVQAKEEEWEYAIPSLAVPIQSVAIGLDGTCMLLCQDGYRQAMVGSVSLYDAEGQRQYTLYVGATPEYGKGRFLERLRREITRLKARYPQARYIGVADGAHDNWSFLEPHTSVQVIDFYHASGYLAAAAAAAHPHDPVQRSAWLTQHCHRLKHEPGAARALLTEMQQLANNPTLSTPVQEQLESAITYFYYHHPQMDYARCLAEHWPLGSGVTEAACKTLVKQRLCQSGMRWKERGAGIILSLRALVMTDARWQQFWDKINQYGFPVTT